MKIKPLKIVFEGIEQFKNRVKKKIDLAVTTGNASVQSKDTLIWASVEQYQKFMSDQKYAILAAVYNYQPKSVYQLAKILGRAQQNVARDCELLYGHGFIRFEGSVGGRKTKAPRLAFSYNCIEVHLPAVTYKIEFVLRAA